MYGIAEAAVRRHESGLRQQAGAQAYDLAQVAAVLKAELLEVLKGVEVWRQLCVCLYQVHSLLQVLPCRKSSVKE